MIVRAIDRRVLLVHVAVEVGLVTCVWGRSGKAAGHSTPVSGGTGFCLLPQNEVEVAEVLDVGHVGEDRTEGKRTNGTFNNDLVVEHVTQISFHLEPMRCAHIGKNALLHEGLVGLGWVGLLVRSLVRSLVCCLFL